MLFAITFLHAWAVARPSIADPSGNDAGRRVRGEAGQATAEYALVLMGAAALAVLLIAWATKTDKVGALFDLILDKVTGKAK